MSIEEQPEIVRITDVPLIQSLKSNILGFWNERKHDNFPAPLPVSLERKDIHKINQYQYLICEKTNGIRYLLMCYDENTYIINRAFNIFKVKQNFNSKIYYKNACGLLLDGEMIQTGEDFQYVVHDCICAFNVDKTKENFNERYEEVSNIIENLYEPEGDFKIVCKKFYHKKDLAKLAKIIENDMKAAECGGTGHGRIDGLIFTPVTLPIGTGTQYTLFKWKVKAQHTFDFRIRDKEDKFEAYVSQGSDEILFASVDKNTPEGLKFGKLLRQNCKNFKSGDIVELEYDELNDTFNPILLRTDKTASNNLYCIEKTLKNIRENITLEELVKAIK